MTSDKKPTIATNSGDTDKYKNICRFLAFVLRHKPQVAHLKLDENGAAELSKVSDAIERRFKLKLTNEELSGIIKKYAHGFFKMEDGKIRAKFGHTIILNMHTPDGFESTRDVPHTLYACVNRNEMWNITKNGMQGGMVIDGFTDKKLDLKIGNNLVVVVGTEKALKNNVEFFYNKSSNRYFCKFVPVAFLKFEL
jgi:putative RNA 2'-phosphotransferase